MSGEFDWIALARAIATHPAARGLDDDAAVLPFGGETLVCTHDAMVEGVHWLPGQDMADVAWKLVATNCSDLAAKGAEPVGLLLGYQLGSDDNRFATGLAEACAAFGAPLIGGDTVSAPTGAPRHLGLTALGRATHTPVPARSGARPGDGIWVTGALGGAMIGCEALQRGETDPATTRAFRRPVPRLAEGRALAPLVTAMMDISDGLLLDATRMGRASGATMALARASVPLAAPEPRRDDALRWGDDYELLFTLPPGIAAPVPATCIGAVEPGDAPLTVDGALPLAGDALGYRHG